MRRCQEQAGHCKKRDTCDDVPSERHGRPPSRTAYPCRAVPVGPLPPSVGAGDVAPGGARNRVQRRLLLHDPIDGVAGPRLLGFAYLAALGVACDEFGKALCSRGVFRKAR